MIVYRYGISRQNERFNAEIRDLYASYITGVIPPGNGDLKGDEVESIIALRMLWAWMILMLRLCTLR